MYLKQVQVNKQIQDQGYSYEIMGNLFSALEWYAKRYSGESFKNQKMIFNGYNNFHCGNQKDLDDLKNQIITQIEIFKFSYQIYIKENNKYDFPHNLQKQQIIELLKNWKKMIPDEKEHKFYDLMIEIINGNFNISFINELQKKIENEGKDGTIIDPNVILQGGVKVVNYSQQMGEQIMKEVENNPNYQPEMKLGQDSPSDIQIKMIEDDKNKKMNNNLKNKSEINIISILENCFYFGECYFILNNNVENYETKYIANKEYLYKILFFYIQSIFDTYLFLLENCLKDFKKKYGDSESITSFIHEHYKNASFWKQQRKEYCFIRFLYILDLNEN